MAVLALVALVAIAAMVTLGDDEGNEDDDDPEQRVPPVTTTTEAPEVEVVALREAPWPAGEAGLVVALVVAGGDLWVVDVDAGRVTSRLLPDLAGGTTLPRLGAVTGGHLVASWSGRVHAVPLAGGPTVDLGPVASDVPQPAVFASARDGAVWVVTDVDDDHGAGPATGREVALEERGVDGSVLTRTTGTFPREAPPFADSGDDEHRLVTTVDAGDDGLTYVLVDPDTHGQVPVATVARPAMVLAAGGGTLAVVQLDECSPSCEVVLVDLANRVERRVPAPDGAGARLAPGSVAPGGRWMVHVASSTDGADPRPRYVVTDLATARSRVTEVTVGPEVAWSADGSHFVASPTPRGGRGTDSRLFAYDVHAGEVMELPVRVQIPVAAPWYLAGARP